MLFAIGDVDQFVFIPQMPAFILLEVLVLEVDGLHVGDLFGALGEVLGVQEVRPAVAVLWIRVAAQLTRP